MPVSEDEVIWAYRVLLDRSPENATAVTSLLGYRDIRAVRRFIISSPEFQQKNPGLVADLDRLVVIADLASYGSKGRLFVNLSDCIGAGIANGNYERAEIEFVKTSLKPGQTFIDIGGNIGLFSIVASEIVGPKGRVFTFEPLPQNLDLLEKTIKENQFCSNVSLQRVALGDQEQPDAMLAYQLLADGSGNSGGSYLVSQDDGLPEPVRTTTVPLTTLDNVLGAQPVDLIKIDIEGAEALAMKGASEILRTQSPLILSEIHPAQLRLVAQCSCDDYFQLMESFGYYPSLLNGEKIHKGIECDKIYNVIFAKH